MRQCHVGANWDAEAGVWVSRSDLPGLVIETATLAEFEALMRVLVPEMLTDRGAPAPCPSTGTLMAHSKSWRRWQATSIARSRTVIVPRSRSRPTANEVLRQAGLPKAF